MWRESYRIGIDGIDKQHIKLFAMVDDLMKAIESNAEGDVFRQAVKFLKDYVVYHFNDEEAYQESIHYQGITEHKKAHRDFTNTVLLYEKKLIDTEFDIGVVKDLAGLLTAWLIYHVADADQKIAGKGREALRKGQRPYLECFLENASGVLEKLVGMNLSGAVQRKVEPDQISGDIFVKLGITGGEDGSVLFCFSRELAFYLMEVMTFMRPEQIDEMVCSALGEVVNITGGNAATELAGHGTACDILPPVVLLDREKAGTGTQGVWVETEHGSLVVALQGNLK